MKKIFCAAVLLVFALSAYVRAQGVVLQYKYARGAQYNYRDVMQGKSTQEVMNQEVKSEMSGTDVIGFIPDSVSVDGSIVLTARIDSAVLSVKGPGMDTTRSQDELIGKRFQFTLAKNGKVSRFTVLDGMDPQSMQMIQTQLGKYPVLSDTAVTIGSTWSASSIDTTEQGQFGGKFITDTKEEYTLAGMETKNGCNCCKVTSTGTFTINGSGSMQGTDLKLEGTGKSIGIHYIDPIRGVLVQSDSNVEIDMTIGVMGQQQMVIPATQSLSVTRTLMGK